MQDFKLIGLAAAMLALGVGLGYYVYSSVDDTGLINAFNFAVSETENFRSAHPADDRFTEADVPTLSTNRYLVAHDLAVKANLAGGAIVYRMTLRDLNKRQCARLEAHIASISDQFRAYSVNGEVMPKPTSELCTAVSNDISIVK
ncbi:hypothetical protein QTL95_21790 [Rhizobium sp. S152]|uniref:hypothetical protein n=1 Tax=Rhizobium sp. S152 TaxID=3055038 RepID=UPI0025AA13F6|nr:hypothetical protein [Rhizobium sp. S152]MDM9628534.1 hypothetical protein [Rhizobium sp. S152]